MAKQKRADRTSEIPSWSWATAALGLVFAAASIGFMLYQAFVVDEFAPEIVIETEAIVPNGNGYLVKIRVTNHGGLVVADLAVEGTLKDGGEILETSGITIDYVPAGSQRKAGLFFTEDPREFSLELRAKSYQEP